MKNKIALAVIAVLLWGCDRSDEASPEPEVAVTKEAAPAAPTVPAAPPAPSGPSNRCCQTEAACNLGTAGDAEARSNFEDQCSASGGVIFLGSDLKCESNTCVEQDTAFTRPQL